MTTMYKRYIGDDKELKVIRATHGPNYYEYKYSKYDPDHIVTAVIARLKSKQPKRKVLTDFHNDKMIFDLIRNLGKNIDRQQDDFKEHLICLRISELVEQAEKEALMYIAVTQNM